MTIKKKKDPTSHKEAIRRIRLGKRLSDEHREKIAAGVRRYWASAEIESKLDHFIQTA